MSTVWPELPYPAWRDTQATLQLWTQIVGKIRLTQTPWLNHSWHVALYVTSRGLTTSPIPHGDRTFEIQFDFIAQQLVINVSDGATRLFPLRPQAVADFYTEVMTALQELHVPVKISEHPCEIPGAIRFTEDRVHQAYDTGSARRFWQALVQIDRVFKQFRTGFVGKASPVHFFWGSFDLAVTRFSGRRAPAFAGTVPGLNPRVMQEAYSHEVSSAGFWPGGGGIDSAAFYSYAYPTPAGFKNQPVRHGTFNETLGEFLLPYDDVRAAANPDAMLLEFLQSTYEAAAETAKWDRNELECPLGEPKAVRT
ncbi:MAG TPA: DUF5996 family protein [Steroidobacteraceae bacterium]